MINREVVNSFPSPRSQRRDYSVTWLFCLWLLSKEQCLSYLAYSCMRLILPAHYGYSCLFIVCGLSCLLIMATRCQWWLLPKERCRLADSSSLHYGFSQRSNAAIIQFPRQASTWYPALLPTSCHGTQRLLLYFYSSAPYMGYHGTRRLSLSSVSSNAISSVSFNAALPYIQRMFQRDIQRIFQRSALLYPAYLSTRYLAYLSKQYFTILRISQRSIQYFTISLWVTSTKRYKRYSINRDLSPCEYWPSNIMASRRACVQPWLLIHQYLATKSTDFLISHLLLTLS